MGCGVDLPPHHAYPRRRRTRPNRGEQAQPTRTAGDRQSDETGGEAAAFSRTSRPRGARFRRRHRIHGPFALYGGRIDPGKGCEELIEYFSSYVQDGGDASLVLMGVKLMPLPEEPFIRFAGLLSEQERLQALEAATVVVCPSPYESLSLLALEALAVGTPILATRAAKSWSITASAATAASSTRDRDEFVECLKLLVCRRAAARRDGPHGPRLRAAELPLGRRARQVRPDDREGRSDSDGNERRRATNE